MLANCENHGEVTATASARSYSGGIAGLAYNGVTLANCVNHSTVTAKSSHYSAYAGGIAGLVDNSATLVNCYWGELTAIDAIGNDYSTVAVVTNCSAFASGSLLLTAPGGVIAGGFATTNLHSALNRHVLANPAANGTTLAAAFYPELLTVFLTPTPEPRTLVGNVPYSWFEGHGLVPAGSPPADYEAEATEDADGDGQLNWQEYVAGTDPNDSASRFLVFITVKNGVRQITWEPNLGTRSYQVQSSDTLEPPYWQESAPQAETIIPQQFYRVQVRFPHDADIGEAE